MRFFGIVGVSAACLWVAACGDDEGGAIVHEDISWKLQGQGVHAGHTQAAVDQRFKVSCSRNASGLTVRIEDPGFKGDPAVVGGAGASRPAGALEIRNGNPALNICNVTVEDADTYGAFPVKYTGTCGTVCSLTGQYKFMGWDFSGSLTCNGLTASGSGALAQNKYSLVNTANSGAVAISVDNCN